MINRLINFEFTVFNITIRPKKMIKNPFVSGSLIMVIGSNIANFFAYIYHLIMGRMLGPEHYGELAAIIASIALFSTAFTFFGLVIVKFVSSAKKDEVGDIYDWFFGKGIKISIVLACIALLLSGVLSSFIHVDIKMAFLIGPILGLMLMTFLIRSFLQGLLRFRSVVIINNIDLLGRLLIGLFLVYFGYKSFGAVTGIFIASTITFIIGRRFLSDVRASKKTLNFDKSKDILRYAAPVLLISIANNSFMTSDIILVKHYLPAHTAGIYASLSTLGKVIFYGSGPIGAVMFPIISKRYSQKKPFIYFLVLSLFAILGLGLFVLLIYAIFPELMVRILFGEAFLSASGNLVWFGLFALILTLSNTITAFYLSIERTKIWIIPVIYAILQIILILVFHANIMQVVQVSIASVTLFLVTIFLYLLYDYKKIRK